MRLFLGFNTGFMADTAAFRSIDPLLRSALARTRALLAWERYAIPAALALAPLAIYAFLGLGGAYDNWALAPPIAALTAILAAAGLAVAGLRGKPWPSLSEARARLAADNPSELRPLTALGDPPLSQDQLSLHLWAAHRAQVLAAARAVKPAKARPVLARADRFGLRYGAALAIAISFAAAALFAPQRIERLFAPDFGAFLGLDRLAIEAWATPPAFSGAPPIYLTAAATEAPILAPKGSQITIRVRGGAIAPHVRLNGQRVDAAFTLGPDRWREAKFILNDSGPQVLTLNAWGRRAAWRFAIGADAPPEISFVETPMRGEEEHLDFVYAAKDDVGVAETLLEMALVAPLPGERALPAPKRLPIASFGGGAREISGSPSLDLTTHPWAGLEVRLRAIVIDGAGQEGATEAVDFTLPERLFLQPLARAAQDVRLMILRVETPYPERPPQPKLFAADAARVSDIRDEGNDPRLSIAPKPIKRARRALFALTQAPEYYRFDRLLFMGFARAGDILDQARSLEDVGEAADLLWEVALRAEFGDVADVEAAFEQARRALQEALENGADEQEIERLSEAYQQAFRNLLDFKRAQAQPGDGQGGQGERTLSGDELEELLQALNDLSETGATQEALALLERLSELLRNLQFQQGGAGEGQGQQDEPDPSEQALRELNDILGEQRGLRDRTFDERRRDANPGQRRQQPGQRSGQQGEGQEPGADPQQNGQGEGQGQNDGEALDEAQRGLSDRLGERADRLRRGGVGAGSRDLQAAQEAMREAADALARGDLRGAQDRQDAAIDALRRGTENAARQAENNRDGPRRDPLGRALAEGGEGGGDSGDVDVPTEAERKRARDVLEELRRRAGDRRRADTERSYLERLLDRFGAGS